MSSDDHRHEPSVQRVHHVGVSVADLNRSATFYEDLLGFQRVSDSRFGGKQYERIMDLPATSGRVVVLQLADFELELFEFDRPGPSPAGPPRPVSDRGITHFCLEVRGIEAITARLQTAGVPFHCSPLAFGAVKATYGRDPDGNVFELLEMPEAEQASG